MAAANAVGASGAVVGPLAVPYAANPPAGMNKVTKVVLSIIATIGAAAAAIVVAGAITVLSPLLVTVAAVVAAVALGALILYGLYRLGCYINAKIEETLRRYGNNSEQQLQDETQALTKKFLEHEEAGFFLADDLEQQLQKWKNLQNLMKQHNIAMPQIPVNIETLEILKKLSDSQRLMNLAKNQESERLDDLTKKAAGQALKAHQLIAKSQNKAQHELQLGAAVTAMRKRIISVRQKLQNQE